MKPKNSNCDKTQKLKLWQNSQNQIVTTLKNSNFDKKTKNKIVTKLKLWQNSKCEEKKLKQLKYDKTKIVTKLKNSNYDKTQNLNC